MIDVIVIGAGAAGSICAITAAENGNKVVVFEPNRQIARKVRITGKGRCNLTNSCSVQDFIQNVPNNSKFLYSALNSFSPQTTMQWFTSRGLDLKIERGNRVFPVSDNANEVADLLFSYLQKNHVEIIHEYCISVILKDDFFEVKTKNGSSYQAENVVLACGGMSYPATGSDGYGYNLAKKLGHKVITPQQSLVPLNSPDEFCAEMAGFSPKNITLTLFEENKAVFSDFGEMLFTHFGVSGPLVLSASAHMNFLKDYHIEIDFKPALTEEKLDERLLRDFAEFSNRMFCNSLDKICAKSMRNVIVNLSDISPEQKVNSITKVQRQNLVHLLKHFPVRISGPRPFSESIVTRGGVHVAEINPRTMESKLVPRLYFAGEILDVDAYTGGFNLQIAWSTGHLAGLHIGGGV